MHAAAIPESEPGDERLDTVAAMMLSDNRETFAPPVSRTKLQSAQPRRAWPGIIVMKTIPLHPRFLAHGTMT